MEILVFLVSAFVGMLDPINIVCMLLAGLILKKYFHAILAGVVSVGALHLIIVIPVAKAEHSDYSIYYFFTTITAGFIGTSLIYGIKNFIKFKKETNQNIDLENET